MENKINIAELLKNCHSGMELNCALYEDVYFDYVDEFNVIHCYIQHETHKTSIVFNPYGTADSEVKSKCVLFPKGKTTWEGFHRPFKDGDVLFVQSAYSWILIYKESENDEDLYKYVAIPDHTYHTYMVYGSNPLCCKGDISKIRLATEEEKAKLFDAIKENGYKWNPETKTLEKLVEPMFKVGDKIKHKNGKEKNGVEYGKILSISDDKYDVAVTNDMGIFVPIADQDDWELVPNKFDISTLKPFESKVLIRGGEGCFWKPAIFGFYKILFYVLGGNAWSQCIPYEGNEHLLGTTNDCDEFYRIWK